MSKEKRPRSFANNTGLSIGAKSSSGLSRRSFIAGAGLGAAAFAGLGLTACAPQTTTSSNALPEEASSASLEPNTVQFEASKSVSKHEEKSADMVVIGSGIAGMSAATQASEMGLSVIVLEKNSVTGGDSSICSGNYYCCGSKYQDFLGLSDYGTADEIADFFFMQSDGDASREICKLVAEHGGEGLDWLVDHGCSFKKKPGDNVSDRSMLSENSGKGIIDALVAASEQNGVELLMQTRAIEILMADGKVSGVVARQDEIEYKISAPSVLVASGGFDGQDWSKELYAAKGTVGWHTFSTPTNTGDGNELARMAGASIICKGGLSQIHLVGWDPLPLNDDLSKLRIINTGVFITDLGYRCANESMTSQFDYFVPFVQSGRSKFAIVCDSQQADERLQLLNRAVEKGVAFKANSLEDLASQADIPGYPLSKTIQQYNELCEQGEDPFFHKKIDNLIKVNEAPYYLVQITPNTNDSFGCIAISTKAEALDGERKPVPGLYAAGTAANAELFYRRYAVSGASLCMGTVTGRIAAQSIKEYLGK